MSNIDDFNDLEEEFERLFPKGDKSRGKVLVLMAYMKLLYDKKENSVKTA